MEALQQALQEAEQERDAAQALTTEAAAQRATAQATAAQALLDLAAAQAVAAAAATRVGAVTFALYTALASNLLLDYRTGEGIKIYGKAKAPLNVLFNGDSGGLRLFLSKVPTVWSSLVRILGPNLGDSSPPSIVVRFWKFLKISLTRNLF
jgi:hypothetical protein